jgi:hypothetical protein
MKPSPTTRRAYCCRRLRSDRSPAATLVVIAEDLGQHVLFVRLDDGFLPAWSGKCLRRPDSLPVSHDDEFARAVPTLGQCEHPARASTMGTPVSRTKRSNSSSFPG